jgi:hypothetical protein
LLVVLDNFTVCAVEYCPEGRSATGGATRPATGVGAAVRVGVGVGVDVGVGVGVDVDLGGGVKTMLTPSELAPITLIVGSAIIAVKINGNIKCLKDLLIIISPLNFYFLT